MSEDASMGTDVDELDLPSHLLPGVDEFVCVSCHLVTHQVRMSRFKEGVCVDCD